MMIHKSKIGNQNFHLLPLDSATFKKLLAGEILLTATRAVLTIGVKRFIK